MIMNECTCGDPRPHSDHCGCCGRPGFFPNGAFCQDCTNTPDHLGLATTYPDYVTVLGGMRGKACVAVMKYSEKEDTYELSWNSPYMPQAEAEKRALEFADSQGLEVKL